MHQVHGYRVEVFFSEEDEGFIARTPGFPYLSAFGETEAEALREIAVVVEVALDALAEDGEEPPVRDAAAPGSPEGAQ